MKEFYENELDNLIDFLKELPEERIKIINPERYALLLQTSKQLEWFLKKTGEEAEINININEMFNLGAVSTEIASIFIDDATEFSKIISKADNVEIYPLLNGNIKLDITFQSVLKSIEK